MAGITRLGLGGFSRPRYGDFTGRTPVEPPVVEASLGNLGFGEQEDPRKRRRFKRETLKREIEQLFEETRDIKVPKAVEQQIVKIVAPGSDKIPSGVPIGDLLQSTDQMRELRDLLEDLRASRDDEDALILLMMA